MMLRLILSVTGQAPERTGLTFQLYHIPWGFSRLGTGEEQGNPLKSNHRTGLEIHGQTIFLTALGILYRPDRLEGNGLALA